MEAAPAPQAEPPPTKLAIGQPDAEQSPKAAPDMLPKEGLDSENVGGLGGCGAGVRVSQNGEFRQSWQSEHCMAVRAGSVVDVHDPTPPEASALV